VAGTACACDDNGNLAFDGQFRYYYDCESRLIDINDANDAPVASYAYDYLGRRISRTIYGAPNVTIKYAYDGDRIIAEYDGSGTLLRKFIYGPGLDEPICLVEVADNNAVYYYHFDGLGSVVALSDMNSVLVERYTYDVFGRPTIRDANGTEIAESAFANPYLFTGRAYDAETGLYYYRARYYDYATARFLQPDPLGYEEGMNIYAYCADNPLRWADPFGLYGQGTQPLGPETPAPYKGHSDFGYGYGYFDYNRADRDFNPHNPYSTYRHFRNRADVERDLEKACQYSDPTAFEYHMHELQDTYSHMTAQLGGLDDLPLATYVARILHVFRFNPYRPDDPAYSPENFIAADEATRRWEDKWIESRLGPNLDKVMELMKQNRIGELQDLMDVLFPKANTRDKKGSNSYLHP
jgi:RHS repeat-associated protein